MLNAFVFDFCKELQEAEGKLCLVRGHISQEQELSKPYTGTKGCNVSEQKLIFHFLIENTFKQ